MWHGYGGATRIRDPKSRDYIQLLRLSVLVSNGTLTPAQADAIRKAMFSYMTGTYLDWVA